MGMWDLPCPVCGANLEGPGDGSHFESKKAKAWVKRNNKKLQWLDEIVAVLSNGKSFEGHYNGYGEVISGNKEINIDGEAKDEGIVGLHTACWELLNKPSAEWMQQNSLGSGSGWQTPLEPFAPFQEQFFDWEGFILEGKDLWAAFDPRLDRRSRERIERLILEKGGPYHTTKTSRKGAKSSRRGTKTPPRQKTSTGKPTFQQLQKRCTELELRPCRGAGITRDVLEKKIREAEQ